MITVSVKQLVDSIMEADVYKFPDMNEGTGYLYNNLYKRISNGEDVRLSQINYNAFELDDIDSMRDLYSDVLERNEYKTDSLARTLRGLSPAATAPAFV